MPYPATIPSTDELSSPTWLSAAVGPYENGAGVRFLFFTVNVFNGGTGLYTSNLTAWRSVDSGQTWAIVDGASSPLCAGDAGLTAFSTFRDPNPANHTIWVAYPNPVGAIVTGPPVDYRATPVIQSFDMDTATWGATITGGPTMYHQVGEGNHDAFRPQLFVYANGDFQLMYQSAFENVMGQNYDRVSTALYSGAWGAGQPVWGVGEEVDYAPMNMVLGDAGRVHLFGVSAINTSIFRQFGDRKMHHRAMNAQVLEPTQVVTADIVPASALGGGDFVSSAVTRPDGLNTEILVGYLRPATANPLLYTSFPAVARAMSADSPVWAQEFVNSDAPKASTRQFVDVPIMIVGSAIIVVWSEADENTWYSVNVGSGWSVAQLLFNDPAASTGQYNNGMGLSGAWGYVTANFLHPGLILEYFELAGTIVVECDSPPNGKIGFAYSHFFPASTGVEPYTFAISSGALPTGLSLNAATGEVAGNPSAPGVFTFTVEATDSAASTAEVECSIRICPGNAISGPRP